MTREAAVKRINRRLARDGYFVRVNRNVREWDNGFMPWRYWVIDAGMNVPIDAFDDPEKYGRELGVVQAYEKVEGA